MNEEVVAEKKRNSPPREAGGAKSSRRFTVAEKLKAVRLHKEEGFSIALVCRELNVSNQMWQTNIFTFRLGGRYAYLIAFMDDYSRFIVGADLFRSPTAPSVIEVYRVAV
jgi:hypothetical protein